MRICNVNDKHSKLNHLQLPFIISTWASTGSQSIPRYGSTISKVVKNPGL